jgi:DNA-binding MarR family transcriptional regulator
VGYDHLDAIQYEFQTICIPDYLPVSQRPKKEPETEDEVGVARRRRRFATAIGQSLRELAIQLSLLNHQIGARLELRDVDIDCLDLIDREGPLSPSALARVAGLHPATITGILDRLERGGWITREPDPADRRAILVRSRRERLPDLLRLYAGMNRSMNQIYAGYDEGELEAIADFLERTAKAGRTATEQLGQGSSG